MRHKSLVPWLIALVCLGPFGLAMLLYYGPRDVVWLPQLPGQRELLDTPVPLPAAWLDGTPGAYRWSLIYARMAACDRQCTRELTRLLKVRQALGKDQEHVQRALWYAGDAPGLADPELKLQRLDESPGPEVAAALGLNRNGSGRIFVADPRGDVILSYPVDVEQKELLRDLKRLLAGTGS